MWGDNSFGRAPPPVTVAAAESQTVAVAADDSQLQMITKLTERNKTQGHLLRAWKQRLREQVNKIEPCNRLLLFLSERNFITRLTI